MMTLIGSPNLSASKDRSEFVAAPLYAKAGEITALATWFQQMSYRLPRCLKKRWSSQASIWGIWLTRFGHGRRILVRGLSEICSWANIWRKYALGL